MTNLQAHESLYTPGNILPEAVPAPKNHLSGSGTFVLAAATAEPITVPAGAAVALFQGELGVDFWWNPTATATIPAADDTTDPTFINPVMENIAALGTDGTQTFSVIAAAETKVSIRFY